MLLFRETSVRVVVTSANLVSQQWDTLGNVVWSQDFPALKSGQHGLEYILPAVSQCSVASSPGGEWGIVNARLCP